jgi:NADPH:quinone reductase-like Zn-dependent oxidoreductase
LTRWYRQATSQAITAMFDQLLPLFVSGKLHIPIEKIYPLAEITSALGHAQRQSRSGKIIVSMSSISSPV